MKKTYETPSVEKVEFKYRDQVVVASGCVDRWVNIGETECTDGNKHLENLN